jgi:hypothetical protein
VWPRSPASFSDERLSFMKSTVQSREKIQITCPKCGKTGSLKSQLPVGTKIRCKECNTSFETASKISLPVIHMDLAPELPLPIPPRAPLAWLDTDRELVAGIKQSFLTLGPKLFRSALQRVIQITPAVAVQPSMKPPLDDMAEERDTPPQSEKASKGNPLAAAGSTFRYRRPGEYFKFAGCMLVAAIFVGLICVVLTGSQEGGHGILGFVEIYVIGRIWWAYSRRCPHCRCMASLKHVKSTILRQSQQMENVRVQDTHRDRDHRVIGYTDKDRTLLVTYSTILKEYTCQCCGKDATKTEVCRSH